jgi:hypothetical protein
VKEQAFEEGRQYTRIYMDADHLDSWEDIRLYRLYAALYRKDSFQSLLRLIDEVVKVGGQDRLPLVEPTFVQTPFPLKGAFTMFVNEQRILRENYYVHPSLPNFVEPEWTQLPSNYQVTEKYWLGYPLIAWFERRNSTVRLIVEVGPLRIWKEPVY